MESALSLFLILSSLLLWAGFALRLNRKESNNGTPRPPLPPGPPGWPILGNILGLGTFPHQTFQKLRPKYGPLLWLKLGSVNTLVIQSSKAASELFKHHDNNFRDRKCAVVWTAHNFNQGSVVMGQYGTYWRLLRRLYSSEFLVNQRINETASIRQKCIDNMLRYIEEDAAEARAQGKPGEVNLVPYLYDMTFNVIGNLTLSRDLINWKTKQGMELLLAMNKVMECAGKPNLVDFFPALKILDPQGLKRKMARDMGGALEIVSGFVKERVEESKLKSKKMTRDFLDALLEYEGDGKEGPDRISSENINLILLEIFFAGSETTSSTIEWAMTELLRNPETMRKAKKELDRVVGQNRKVEETDMNELPYLKAIVKETVRLHPPTPLLIPRNAVQDTEFMGYLIPKDTQVLVNAWAIGRDPECWEDPMSFKPERFLGSNIDYKGQNFELIPFGSGRRICAGISLADRVLHLSLASLIHCFDWELGSNVTPDTIDMNESQVLTLRKLIPLKLIPIKRVMRKYDTIGGVVRFPS